MPIGRTDRRRWLRAAANRAVRLALERDEVDYTASPRKVGDAAILYGGVSLLSLGFSGALWIAGREELALTILIVGNGLLAFFGTIAIGWDLLALFVARRNLPSVELPEGALTPDFALSQDTKISFVIAVTLLVLITASVSLAEALG